jgi:hypothetical protein
MATAAPLNKGKTREPVSGFGLEVLAYARDSNPGQGWLWPVEWTVHYGKGRVYIATYGR